MYVHTTNTPHYPHTQALNQEPEVEGAVLAATEEYALREGKDGQLLPNAQSLTNVFGLVLVAYVNVRVWMGGLMMGV